MKTRFKKGDTIKCVQYDGLYKNPPRINYMEIATVEHSEDGIFYGDGFGNYCEDSDAYAPSEDGSCDDEGNTLNEEGDE